MKLIFCDKCGTITAPMQHPYPIIYKIPVSCLCKDSWCWWENAEQGILKVVGEHAYAIGIANNLLNAKTDGVVGREEMDKLIAEIPDNYLFKLHSSLIVKYKPGITGDTLIATREELEKQIEETKRK